MQPTPSSKPIRLFATLTAQPGQRDALLEALEKNVAGSRKEPGNIAFEVFEDTTTPGTFYLVEDWQSMEAIAAHRETPHFKEYSARAQTLLAQRAANYAIHIPLAD